MLLNLLGVRLCKPVIHKLKILGGGGGKLEYYINHWGKPQKAGGPNFEISVGGSKRGRGNTIFESNLLGGILEETMNKPMVLNILGF